MQKRELKEKLQKIFDYSEFMYQQPRDSNGDSVAFLNIGTLVGKVFHYLDEQSEKERHVKA